MKRKLLLLLALMAMGLSNVWAYNFSAVAPSGQTLYYDIVDGNARVTSQNSSYPYYSTYPLGSLEIPASVTYNGTTYSVTSIGQYAFYNCSGLTGVTIPNSVTSIGGSAFYFCSGLTSVTIPNSVTSIGTSAFSRCTGLTSVTIPNSVTSIGGSAFEYCIGLTSVTIPNSVTSIGTDAFGYVRLVSYCGSATGSPWGATRVGCFYEDGEFIFEDATQTTILAYIGTGSSVTIPNSVTSIGNSAFAGCSGLTSVTIPNSVTSIGNYAFEYCSGLTSVTIPNSVTSIGNYAFEYCSGLTSVTIPNSVTSIGTYAFRGCSGLTGVIIPNSVTSIGNNAFGQVRLVSYCGSATGRPWGAGRVGCFYEDGEFIFEDATQTTILAYIGTGSSVTIPNSVTSIGSSAFRGCSGLTSVTIPNSVTTIGERAFYDCSGLTSVTIGNSVISIGPSAFDGCSGLTSVTIPNSVRSIGTYAFDGCSGLTSVTIPNSVTYIGYKAFSGCSNVDTLYYNARNLTTTSDWYNSSSSNNSYGFRPMKLRHLVIGDSVQTLPAGVFYGQDSLTSVTIPNSVTTIGERAFYDCSGLTSVTIPNSVTTIGEYAFDGCSGLTSVTIPNSVTSIGSSVFRGCSGLTSVTIPNSVTSIGSYAFYGCSGLTSVTIPNSVTYIGTYAFGLVRLVSYCGSATGSPWGGTRVGCFYEDGEFIFEDATQTTILAYIGTGTSVSIPNSVTTIGDYVFYNCSGLTSVTIPNSVTSIGDWTFYGCSGLTSVTIPNSVTSIGDYAFYYCSGLTSVTIPNSVTSIGDCAFHDCWGLTSVTIGNSVTSIGDFAFYGCDLTSVTIPNSVTYIGYDAFSFCWGLTSVTMRGTVPPTLGGSVFSCNASNRKIYVPCGAYETYYNANNGWSDYRNYLSDPIVDIDVTVNAESGKGSASIIPLRGQNVRCDSTIVVTATPNYGYHFDHWSTGGTQTQDTIAIEGDTMITAYFAKNQYAINVVPSNANRGQVFGSDTIDYLDSVTISAVANYGYHFTRWNDNDTHQVRTVQVTQNKTYTAYFDFNQYQLTAASANAVQGSCSGSGAYNYLSNRTIQATANYGYHFTQWSDGNIENPRTIQLTQDTLFTAEFAKNQYQITLLSDDASLGSVDGGGSFDYLDTITLMATPLDHHHLVRWNDGNRENLRQWVVTSDTTLTAYFAIDTHRVTVVSNDPTRGIVNSFGTEFSYMSPCTVTATAYTGFVFTGWSNGVTANPYTFAVQNDVELTAIFVSEDELMFTITVESDDPVMGSVSGGGMAMSGGEVAIHAVANEGYHFVRWNDNDTNADRTVTVTEDATYTAYFAADQTESIDKVEQMAEVYVNGGCIVVSGAQDMNLTIYDVVGRLIVREKAIEGKQYPMPHTGVYVVRIGHYPAQKVVVIK